tara:strand:- start:94 stop:525 length:432 start_codon:yes stop_codon:yes gene_type:complete
MKSVQYFRDLPYSKPDISFRFYETTVLDKNTFPDYVKEELLLDENSIVTIEAVKGETPTHTDVPPRQAHLIYYISNNPMTVTTTYGTFVLNYGDSMVIDSTSEHSGSVGDMQKGRFFAIDYGKNYFQTQEIYEKITKKTGKKG